MIERTFRAPNHQLNTFREALQKLLQSKMLTENVLVYAVDSTTESVEEALSSFDNGRDELLAKTQRSDDAGRRYFVHPQHGLQVRSYPQGGLEIQYPAVWDQDPGAIPPDDPEMTWAAAPQAPVQIGDLEIQFVSDEAADQYAAGMEEIGEIQSEATLYLVPEETFYTSENVDVTALQNRGLYRVTRQLVVEGNQGWLDRQEDRE